MIGDNPQDIVQLHDSKILQDLDHGFAAALEFSCYFFVLQIVNQAPFFDEGQ